MNVTIIGGGLSGLATAFAIQQGARRLGLEINLTILEKQRRAGGKIRSEKIGGYLCEWGPNGFLDSKPATLDLCRDAGLGGDLLPSSDAARRRFIFSDGRLQRVPDSAGGFFRSQLVSWPGKCRLVAELLVPRRADGADETLAEFVRRRLGREALDQLVGPMASGIFAGDPESMSLRSCFPRIYELEQQYGGLIRAMLRLARRKRAEIRAGKVVSGAAGPGGILTSFAGGIQQLTDGLSRHLEGCLRLSIDVEAIIPEKQGFVLQCRDGQVCRTRIVVAALPAMDLALQLEKSVPAMTALLQQIPYAPLQVACFGYRKNAVPRELDGFGYLAARRSGLNSLGTLWSSSIFPQRAPDGHVLLRTMFGGATRPDAAQISAEDVQRCVREDLARTLGITKAPDFVRIIRHEAAIPQYVAGHGARLRALEAAAGRYPGLFLAGNAFFGVGLNDCVARANRVAARVLEALQNTR
ncbi:MAG: protoporphyrinogen oxidase [Syntrophotalea acetylenica]|jgi:oxygen-dependent protoporphyrinogen oxidase|nr:protoporphyrinogen oxidase [Syntrophotalea acetylenica]